MATRKKPAKRGGPRGSKASMKLRGIYMGKLNGVTKKLAAQAKKIRATKGIAQAIGFLNKQAA